MFTGRENQEECIATRSRNQRSHKRLAQGRSGAQFLKEVGLYDYRNRVYSENLGRFLQTDPIRFSAKDVNLYRYCMNDPMDWMDPSGLCCEPEKAALDRAVANASKIEAALKNAISEYSIASKNAEGAKQAYRSKAQTALQADMAAVITCGKARGKGLISWDSAACGAAVGYAVKANREAGAALQEYNSAESEAYAKLHEVQTIGGSYIVALEKVEATRSAYLACMSK